MTKNCLIQGLTLVLSLTSLCLQVSLAQLVQYAPEGGSEVFRNMILANSHLLLGSSDALYRLDNNLVKQEKKALEAPNRMLVADYVGSFQDSVLSCDSEGCSLVRITDFTNVSWHVDSPLIRRLGTDNVAGVFAPLPNGTSVLTHGERAGINVGSILLARGALINAGTDRPQLYERYITREELGDRFDPLIYLTEFPLRYANGSGYVYFVTRPTEDETRVVRFCEDDIGGVLGGEFSSHFEIKLRCGSHGDQTSSTAATFLNITTTFEGRPAIFVSSNRIMGMNNMQVEVCVFDIGIINSLMLQKLNCCVRGTGMVGFVRDGQQLCMAVDPDRLDEVVSHLPHAYTQHAQFP